jgi:hypothetical protein
LQFGREPEDLLVESGKPGRLDCQARLEASPGGLLQEFPAISWRSDDGQPISFIGDKYRYTSCNTPNLNGWSDETSPAITKIGSRKLEIRGPL